MTAMAMRTVMNGVLRGVLAVALAMSALMRPALAQSILRDAETEAFLRDVANPFAVAAGLRPNAVDMVLIGDKDINAFVAGGQAIYVHSGLLLAADDVNELQGVVAHEMGHIAGGHAVRFSEGIGQATSITLLSMLLGAAAIAAGAGEAGAAIFAGGQQAALGKFLAYSREQESRTDQAGAVFLEKAGVSGQGSIRFFKKLQNQEFRLAIPQDNAYARTHPLSGDRIAALENVYRSSPHWDKPIDPALQARFLRIKAKLFGFVEQPSRTFQKYPETDTSVPARYARAYAWHKNAFPDKAAAEVDGLLATAPDDPYFLELKGQVLLESGRVEASIPPLRRAVALAPDQPLIAGLLGHALISTEKAEHAAEAKSVLRAAVARDNRNPFAWYQLGIAYAREGDEARAALATAEQHNLTGRPQLALTSARAAMAGLAPGTPDWIRAQDILLVSQAEVEDKDGNRKRRR
jgi:predicted Zn-dependent protease